MKEITVIILLALILSPILRNGLGLVHYLTEHTHAFCLNDKDHQHSATDDCKTVCSLQFEQTHDDQYPSQRIEYQEIKQYISTFPSSQADKLLSNSSKVHFTPYHFGRKFIKEIFHPPIS